MTNQLRHPDWTFLSNHAHVFHCIFLSPDIRIRDIAAKVLITERAVQRIVVDLEREGYLKRERMGRQNHYRIEPKLHLRHPLENHVEVGRLLSVLQSGSAVPDMSVRNHKARAAGTARRRKAVSSDAGAKANLRLKKRPGKPRKGIAKRSVLLGRSS